VYFGFPTGYVTDTSYWAMAGTRGQDNFCQINESRESPLILPVTFDASSVINGQSCLVNISEIEEDVLARSL